MSASPPRITEGVLPFAHRLLAAALRPGDAAVDATVGNGHDTLHLARCVGPRGRVVGFDVQERALQQTRQRLASACCADRVTLLLAGHETLGAAVPDALAEHGAPASPRVAAVCFNLGYLPGGDKTLITRTPTTLTALDAALGLLAVGGVLTAVLYSGHPGGADERDAVVRWAGALPHATHRVLHYRFPNRPRSSELIAVERLTG